MKIYKACDLDSFLVDRFQSPDGNVWYQAKAVCEILEFSNPSSAVKAYCKDDPRKFKTQGRGAAPLFLSRRDVMRLIFKSSSPIAESFHEWLIDIAEQVFDGGAYISPAITDAQARAAIAKLNSILDRPDPWERLASTALLDRIHEFYDQQCSETFWWKYVYNWMTPEERAKLDSLNPVKGKSKQRKTRIHQWIRTEDEIKARLKERLSVVVNILMASPSRAAFEDNMRRLAGFDQKSLFG